MGNKTAYARTKPAAELLATDFAFSALLATEALDAVLVGVLALGVVREALPGTGRDLCRNG